VQSHESCQLPSWLIFDVGQKIKSMSEPEIDPRFVNPEVHAYEIEDRSGMTVYLIESLTALSDEERALAMANRKLWHEEGSTTRYGLPYKTVKVFVPIDWQTLEDPKG
jgi:hypothetical protein